MAKGSRRNRRQPSGQHWTDEQRDTVRGLLKAGKNAAEVARETGFGWFSIRQEAKKMAAAGELGFKPVLPGYEIKKTSTQLGPDGELQREWIQQAKEPGEEFQMPAGHAIKGISALVNGEGRTIQQWIKTREETTTVDLVAALKEAFSGYAAPAIPSPTYADEDLLTVYLLPDLHFGMMSWGKETGESYDLQIATDLVRDLVGNLVAQSRPSRKAIVLGLGDMFHQNDQKNMTPKSGHILDVDGRWPKVLRAGAEIAADIVSLAATKHEEVDVDFIPGNHDPDATVALTVALSMFFRNMPRVTIDEDPSPHFYHRFGLNLIGATHGHTMKPDRMAMMLACDRPKDWGETIFRHFYFGHIHHETLNEVGGVRVESFGTPAAKDAHAHGGGWRASRSLTAITFHRTRGEIGRHRVNVMPGGGIAA